MNSTDENTQLVMDRDHTLHMDNINNNNNNNNLIKPHKTLSSFILESDLHDSLQLVRKVQYLTKLSTHE